MNLVSLVVVKLLVTSEAWLLDDSNDRRPIEATKHSYFHSCMEAIVGGRCACVESEKEKNYNKII